VSGASVAVDSSSGIWASAGGGVEDMIVGRGEEGQILRDRKFSCRKKGRDKE
jgi:hypothetical protein